MQMDPEKNLCNRHVGYIDDELDFQSNFPELLWSYLVNAVPSDLYGERIQVVDGGGTQVVPPIAAQVIVLVSNEYD